VDQYVRVATVETGEVDARADFAALPVGADEVQHVALVGDAALEKARQQPLVDALEDLGGARVH
jgi:hypothetical protein